MGIVTLDDWPRIGWCARAACRSRRIRVPAARAAPGRRERRTHWRPSVLNTLAGASLWRSTWAEACRAGVRQVTQQSLRHGMVARRVLGIGTFAGCLPDTRGHHVGHRWRTLRIGTFAGCRPDTRGHHAAHRWRTLRIGTFAGCRSDTRGHHAAHRWRTLRLAPSRDAAQTLEVIMPLTGGGRSGLAPSRDASQTLEVIMSLTGGGRSGLAPSRVAS
jgi:hypothetical protein